MNAGQTISVIYFVFDPDLQSDVSMRESFASMGAQDFPLELVDITIMATESAGVDADLVENSFGRFAARARVVVVDLADYSQNKLIAMTQAGGDIIAFADSDVIYSPDWLRRIDEHLSNGEVALAGPPRFKDGCLLRTTLLLADLGLLWEEQPPRARYMNLHSFAIRSDVLKTLDHDAPAPFHRFGAPSFMARQLRKTGINIRLDPAHIVVHGLNWKVWLFEKRMRRFAHAAYMAIHDPNASPDIARGAQPTRPLSWLRLWWRWARVYQQRPRRCARRLGLNSLDCCVQRVLLMGLSLLEFGEILVLASCPPYFKRFARENEWW